MQKAVAIRDKLEVYIPKLVAVLPQADASEDIDCCLNTVKHMGETWGSYRA